MVQVKGLIEFHELDFQIDRSRKRLAEILGQLRETLELKAARAELQAREQHLHELHTQQKSAEWDVEQTRDRIGVLERREMGNEVVNPRDLQNVERELKNLRQRQSTLEDRVLAFMEEIEQAQAAFDQQAGKLAEMEASWSASQAHLFEEKKQIEEDLPRWEERRKRYAATLDEPSRVLYERVRAKKGGQAMARVEGGICTGCRISLPANLIYRARVGKDVVYCSSCGRILYVE